MSFLVPVFSFRRGGDASRLGEILETGDLEGGPAANPGRRPKSRDALRLRVQHRRRKRTVVVIIVVVFVVVVVRVIRALVVIRVIRSPGRRDPPAILAAILGKSIRLGGFRRGDGGDGGFHLGGFRGSLRLLPSSAFVFLLSVSQRQIQRLHHHHVLDVQIPRGDERLPRGGIVQEVRGNVVLDPPEVLRIQRVLGSRVSVPSTRARRATFATTRRLARLRAFVLHLATFLVEEKFAPGERRRRPTGTTMTRVRRADVRRRRESSAFASVEGMGAPCLRLGAPSRRDARKGRGRRGGGPPPPTATKRLGVSSLGGHRGVFFLPSDGNGDGGGGSGGRGGG